MMSITMAAVAPDETATKRRSSPGGDEVTKHRRLVTESEGPQPASTTCRNDNDRRRAAFAMKRSSSTLSCEDFTLNKLRFSLLGCHGREAQKEQLRDAYDLTRSAVLSRKTCKSNAKRRDSSSGNSNSCSRKNLVLVGGASGSGKSTLCLTLEKRVERTGGIFAAGKFDIQTKTKPYSAFVEVLLEISMRLHETSGEERAVVGRTKKPLPLSSYKSSSQQLDSCGIKDMAESVTQLIRGSSSLQGGKGIASEANVGPATMKERVRFAFTKFISTVCAQRPLVIFIDDLQWADSASLELLEGLVFERDLSGMLIVGSFRDGDNMTMSLSASLQRIEQHRESGVVDIVKIHLGPLDVVMVNDMIADLLSVDSDKTMSLAQIVHSKTGGNVFFMVQFLKALQEKDILVYNMGLLSWKWDEERVQNDMSVTANVADFLQEKLLGLPADVQRLLQLAACIGASFDEGTIRHVVSKDSIFQGTIGHGGEINAGITKCIDQCTGGDILKVTHIGEDETTKYKFAHDQLQDAAYCLIPVQEKNQTMMKVGEALLERFDDYDDLESHIFAVVDLLNSGISLIRDDHQKRSQLALLNLQAGKKASGSAAFASAVVYLQVGLGLLKDDCWTEQRGTTLDFHSSLCEAQLGDGDFEGMKETANLILRRNDISLDDKFRANCAYAEYLGGVENEMANAMEHCLSVLRGYGVTFPKHGRKPATICSLLKTKKLLKDTSIESVSCLPLMNDRWKENTMRFMCSLLEFTTQVDRTLSPLVVLKSIRWTLRYGLCPYSAPAFGFYASLMCGALNQPRQGYELGKLSLSLAEKMNVSRVTSMTLWYFHTLTNHHAWPLNCSAKPLLKGYELAMSAGDVHYGMFSLVTSTFASLYSGRSLELLEEELQSYVVHAKDYNQARKVTMLMLSLEYVKRLRSVPFSSARLPERLMISFRKESGLEEGGDTYLNEVRDNFELMLAVYFGEYEEAWSRINRNKSQQRIRVHLPRTYRDLLFRCLVGFSMPRKCERGQFWRRRRQLRDSIPMKEIQKIKCQGNPNAMHIGDLLDAEWAALAGDKDTARKYYNKAILIASRNGWIHDRALINERAGEFFLRCGDDYWSQHYLSQSHRSYLDWGALAKAEQLHHKYPDLITEARRHSSPL